MPEVLSPKWYDAVGFINDILALVQVMAWCQLGKKNFTWTNDDQDPGHNIAR